MNDDQKGEAMPSTLTEPRPADPPAAPVGTPAPAPTISVRVQGQAPAPQPAGQEQARSAEPAVDLRNVSVYYGLFRAVKDISFDVPANAITSLIGPSGSGKSTLLRAINRMNDLIPGTRLEGEILYHGQNLYGADVDAVEVRRRIGMVFQKPNPFPKSIYDNVAFGPRIMGYKGNMDQLVEQSLKRAAIWDEVKDKLKQSGLALSGGQQQRLCIARAIAVEPEIILMDEPASALDPRSTLQIEELMAELRSRYTIIIVTHNMQQAARASDHTVFMNMGNDRAGYIVERGRTIDIFTNPKDQLTEDYVSGRFG
jgi:phosphate transport system ATP-binding protein